MILSPTRTPQDLILAVGRFEVESNERYRPHDGLTYCNFFAADVTASLGCPIPLILANDQIQWLHTSDWVECLPAEASRHANQGRPALVTWKNDRGPHGHIAVVVPTPNGEHGVWIAQAGATNSSMFPLDHGFGSNLTTGWVHA